MCMRIGQSSTRPEARDLRKTSLDTSVLSPGISGASKQGEATQSGSPSRPRAKATEREGRGIIFVFGASSASFAFEAPEGLGLEVEVARLGWKGQDLKFRRLPVPALPEQVQTLPF